MFVRVGAVEAIRRKREKRFITTYIEKVIAKAKSRAG